MNNKKILVTGGCGFIGSNFIDFVEENYENTIIYNIDYLGIGSKEKYRKNKNYFFIKDDINNISKHKLPTDFDYIFHFAAESHVDRSIESPLPFISSNISGTLALLEFHKKIKKCRLMMISTDEVYGSIKNGSFEEKDRLNPSSAYSASKASSELLCNSYINTFNSDIIITRCSNNYGPNQFEEKLIPKVINNFIKNKEIPIYDDGLQIREWTYVDDHNKDVIFLAENGKSGEIYNVGAGFEITNIDLVKLLHNKYSKITGKPIPLNLKFIKNARPGHDFRYSISLFKINELRGLKRPPILEKGYFEKMLEHTMYSYILSNTISM